MNEDLLPYYNQELAYLRRLGAEFAATHPKIAGRLQLSPDGTRDPHVERLVQACAFLNARVRNKLDDDFPELAEAFLNVVAPHYLRPFPSAAIVKFTLAEQLADLVGGYAVAQGVAIETESIDGQPCRFRTGSPLTLWPFDVAGAAYNGHPFQAPKTPFDARTDAVARIDLKCFADSVSFQDMQCDRLRFFLRGSSQYVHDLYELVHNNVVGLAIVGGDGRGQPTTLDKAAIVPVGFERNESLLGESRRQFWGYSLLSEYFAFPEKFLMFEVQGLASALRQVQGPRLSLFLYFDRHAPFLERHVSADTFQLGCAPVINLFSHRAEPIALSQTQYEYRVVPDARRPTSNEVFSIDRVTGISPSGERVEFRPFYSTRHGGSETEPRAYWNATRRLAGYAGGQLDRGTEVSLSFVDLDFSPLHPADWVVDVETTCLNRDLPHHLPFGGGQPRLQSPEIGVPVRIECLTQPTSTVRPAFRHGAIWRLISHLSLNHLSLTTDSQDGAALREIVQLHDFGDSAENRKMIDGILGVSSRRIVGRIGDEVPGGFCRGQEVELTLDEEKFSGAGVYLFASVLERFLGEYCSVNSFTQLIAKSTRRDKPIRRWPPRASNRQLL